jgi:outer membrane protein
VSARQAGITAGLTASLLLGGTLATQSRAGDPAALVSDPLRVQPRALRDGIPLPGDEAVPNCATDFVPRQPLDLERAADIALCNSPKTRVTWERIKEQAGTLGEARAAYLPSASGSYTWQREINTYPGRPELDDSQVGHSAFVGASWRLFDFGGRAANRESAEHLLSAALATHDATLQDLLDSLVAAYFDAVRSAAELRSSQTTRTLASNTLLATGHREAGGAVSHNDTLQAQVALAKADLAERREQGAHLKAVALLVYIMGMPPRTPLALPELDTPATDTIGELNQWLQVAETQHPSLVAAREQWTAMERKVTATRSDGRPTVDFTANLFQNGYPNQGLQATATRQTTYGITVTVPLFEGFTRTYKVQEARAQAREAQAQFEDTEHQVLMHVVEAHADAVSALGNLDVCAALVSASQAAAQSSERRYASGSASILELLTSQSNLADAEQQRVQCLSEWYAARLRLLTSAGALGLTRLTRPLAVPTAGPNGGSHIP